METLNVTINLKHFEVCFVNCSSCDMSFANDCDPKTNKTDRVLCTRTKIGDGILFFFKVRGLGGIREGEEEMEAQGCSWEGELRDIVLGMVF